MKYKLLNEKISNAIDSYSNKKGWVAMDDELFVREVFSGDYSQKNLDALKEMIKRESNCFIVRNEDGKMWVANRSTVSNRNKKNEHPQGSVIAFLEQMYAAIVEWLRSIFAPSDEDPSQAPHTFVTPPSPQKKSNKKPSSTTTSSPTRHEKKQASQREKKQPKTHEAPHGSAHSTLSDTKREPIAKEVKNTNKETLKKEPEDNSNTQRAATAPTKVAKDATEKSHAPKSNRKETAEKEVEVASAHLPKETAKNTPACTPKERPSATNDKKKKSGLKRINLGNFSDFRPTDVHQETCRHLVATISQQIFSTDWASNLDRVQIYLPSYLTRIFQQRYRSGQIVESNGYALFHTALYDHRDRSIYMLFGPKDEDAKKSPCWYKFIDFVTEKDTPHQAILDANFPVLPKDEITYSLDNVSLRQLFFDRSHPIINQEKLHDLLLSHLFFLPSAVLTKIPVLHDYHQQLDATSAWKDKVRLMRDLSIRAHEENKEEFDALEQVVKEAIDAAITELRHFPLLAKPALDIEKETIYLSIPLDLDKDGYADTYLEVYNTSEGYEMRSFAAKSEAILNQRLLSSLPNDWMLRI